MSQAVAVQTKGLGEALCEIEHIAVNVGHSTPGQTQGYLDRFLIHGSPDSPAPSSDDATPPAL
jgi:hypothetical protein